MARQQIVIWSKTPETLERYTCLQKTISENPDHKKENKKLKSNGCNVLSKQNIMNCNFPFYLRRKADSRCILQVLLCGSETVSHKIFKEKGKKRATRDGGENAEYNTEKGPASIMGQRSNKDEISRQKVATQ